MRLLAMPPGEANETVRAWIDRGVAPATINRRLSALLVRCDAILRAFNGVDPNRQESAMRSYAKAEANCEAKTSHPLVKPGPIDARRMQKVNWSDPATRAKLAEAYAAAGGDDEKAARILVVSLGSARLARRRHLASATVGRRPKDSLVAGHRRPSSCVASCASGRTALIPRPLWRFASDIPHGRYGADGRVRPA